MNLVKWVAQTTAAATPNTKPKQSHMISCFGFVPLAPELIVLITVHSCEQLNGKHQWRQLSWI